jgi:glycosyltransferase involved in cell wall biosynthesis
MKDKIRVLYISYDGMTDPLGQSQVIPYLMGLSKLNCEIHILSAEKYQAFADGKDNIEALLNKSHIMWHPIIYTKKPPVLSTIKDIFKLKTTASKLHKKFKFDIVHCRSYIAAFAGVHLKQKYGLKFLFDMRGFYADERIDGNLWPQSSPLYRMVYRYFKKKEKQFFSSADYTVSLTYAGKNIIHNKFGFADIPIEVIPCCADLDHFDYRKLDNYELSVMKSNLGIPEESFVLSYLGSVGTWYMPEEMLLFFKALKTKYSQAKFLIITKDNPENLILLIEKHKINRDDIIIKSAGRDEVPNLIAISNISIFFIKPVFSKQASSPTKLAELLGMGKPVVCNSGVGDLDKFVPENNLGIMIKEFSEEQYKIAVEEVYRLSEINSEQLRNTALSLFSLEIGVSRYYGIYKSLKSTIFVA